MSSKTTKILFVLLGILAGLAIITFTILAIFGKGFQVEEAKNELTPVPPEKIKMVPLTREEVRQPEVRVYRGGNYLRQKKECRHLSLMRRKN